MPNDDDDFYPSSPALQQPQPQPSPPAASSELVSEAAASSALGAIRASLAAAAAAEAAQEQQALEARIQATSQLTKPNAGLAAVGEEEEEEEEEDDDDEEEAARPGEGAVHSSPPAAAQPATPGAADAEALEAAFRDATAAALLSAASSTSSGASAQAPPPPPAPALTLHAAQEALLSASALAPYFAGIQSEAVDPSLGCLGRLFAVTLPPALKLSRDAVFACARRPYDGSAPLQADLMAALYHAITGSPSGAPGASWTTIGFQRESDFSTDLRGVGMLGPLQVLALFQRHAAVGRALYQQATLPLHPFPFMIQCLSLTARVLGALRLGKLNRCILAAAAAAAPAPKGSADTLVLTLAHDWFAGLALDFLVAWRSDASASIGRLGHIQMAVIDRAYAAPADVLARLAASEKRD